MTREEFITKFTELTAAQAATNPEYASLREEVLRDYDELNQARLSLDAIRVEHQNLEQNYNQLQSAYTRLYMTNPAVGTPTPNPSPNPEPNPSPAPNPTPDGPTIDSILAEMTGASNENA